MAIDRVRVISNIASGKTGILIAQMARQMGAKVTLLLGPVGRQPVIKGVRIIRFNFFSELHSLIRKELKRNKYEVIIHSAAVSDYQPKISFRHKISSGETNLGLELSPTLRIVDKIKKISPASFLVAFKLEFGLPKNKLIAEVDKLARRSHSDLVVANTFKENLYSAWILGKSGAVLARAESKSRLSKNLLSLIKEKL